MRKRASFITFIKSAFVVISCLYFSEAFIPLMKEINSFSLFEGNVLSSFIQIRNIRVALNIFILAGNCLLLIASREQTVNFISRERILWIFLLVPLASMFWSYDSILTLTRTLVLLNATLSGIYLASHFDHSERLYLLIWVFGISAILSLIFIWQLPELGLMSTDTPYSGAWQGIYANRNILGRMMVLGCLVCCLSIRKSKAFLIAKSIFLSLLILLILGSGSKSSLLSLIFLAGLIVFYMGFQWSFRFHKSIRFMLASTTVALILVLFFNANKILNLFGRDISLTGRVDLWRSLAHLIYENIYLGYGYGAFWQSKNTDYINFETSSGWLPVHGHNGLIDLLIELGLVGLILFMASFISTGYRTICLAWKDPKNDETLFSLGYLIFLILANITESSLLFQKFLWLLYVVTVLSSHTSFNEASHEKADPIT